MLNYVRYKNYKKRCTRMVMKRLLVVLLLALLEHNTYISYIKPKKYPQLDTSHNGFHC